MSGPQELGGLEAFNHSCPSVTGAGIMRQVGAEAQITVWTPGLMVSWDRFTLNIGARRFEAGHV